MDKSEERKRMKVWGYYVFLPKLSKVHLKFRMRPDVTSCDLIRTVFTTLALALLQTVRAALLKIKS